MGTLFRKYVKWLIRHPQDKATNTLSNDFPKIGRNHPCPCGVRNSQNQPIKFKKCHGKNIV